MEEEGNHLKKKSAICFKEDRFKYVGRFKRVFDLILVGLCVIIFGAHLLGVWTLGPNLDPTGDSLRLECLGSKTKSRKKME